ncbi:hypothetical protein ACIPSD_22130 [Pectobacterium sp. CHL-2024]|uniref:hypothetical protein n=1 Tax=Pectobacterium sp. CHL-2024 TaxID=3377079 RepID=UPI00381D9B91
MMKGRYKTDSARPHYDQAITDWLEEHISDGDMMSYSIALYHDGYIYRSIICSGLGEYVQATNFLNSIGLANALAPDARYRGFDALFAPEEDVKKMKRKA